MYLQTYVRCACAWYHTFHVILGCHTLIYMLPDLARLFLKRNNLDVKRSQGPGGGVGGHIRAQKHVCVRSEHTNAHASKPLPRHSYAHPHTLSRTPTHTRGTMWSRGGAGVAVAGVRAPCVFLNAPKAIKTTMCVFVCVRLCVWVCCALLRCCLGGGSPEGRRSKGNNQYPDSPFGFEAKAAASLQCNLPEAACRVCSAENRGSTAASPDQVNAALRPQSRRGCGIRARNSRSCLSPWLH